MTSERSQSSEQESGGGANVARRKAAERLGQTIRRKYELESVLGVGGMATVYAARHRNGARVAIKIMHAEFAREDGVKKRFLREGYVANKVDHPGVVKIVDDDETEHGEPFLVMELLEGETLQQLWKRRKRKVPPTEALAIAAQILDVLVPFHEQNIIHRDLKPANIFICPENVVKLLDFGVAQLREAGEAMTRAGTALGTPSFMSPEQAMGKSDQLDGRSDVFSVGATLYAVLSGKRLHHGRSDNEAFILAATQPAPSLARVAPELDVELIALVDRSLQWDRRKRFPDVAEMRDGCVALLEKLGGQVPLTLSRPPPAPVSERPSQPTIGASPVGLRGRESPRLGDPTRRSSIPESLAPGSSPPSSPSIAPRAPVARGSRAGPVVGNGPGPRGRAIPPPPPQAAARPGLAPVESAAEVELGEGGALEGQHLVLEDADGAKDRLADLFQRIERALPALRQYGFEHPEGKQRLRVIHRIFLEALEDEPHGLKLEVHPFCLTREGATVWEPAAPLDLVPYNLTLATVDTLVLLPGLTEEELSRLLESILLDPTRDEDSDIAAALWEASFQHIEFTLREEFVEADANQEVRFFKETADLEKMAREDLAEAAATAVATDRRALSLMHEATASLGLEASARSALNLELTGDDQRWHERYLDLIVPAFIDAAMRDDQALMIEPVRQYSWRLVQRAAFRELAELHEGLLDRATTNPQAARWGVTPRLLTEALFPGPVLKVLIDAAREGRPASLAPSSLRRPSVAPSSGIPSAAPPGPGDAAAERAVILNGLRTSLTYLGDQHTLAILKLADAAGPGDLADVLLDYVEIHLVSHREAVVTMLDDLAPPLAQRMLAALTASGSDRSVAMLKPLLMSPNPALRCEATALLGTDAEELGKQLLRLLESSDPRLRAAALTTMVRHQVRAAGPGLVRLIETEGFTERTLQEQEQMFLTLYALNAARAESLLVTILDQHGMLADERIDRTRALAARILGDQADSARPIEALENAARRRPWNTQELRMAAGAACEAIGGRLRGQHAMGEVEP